MNSDLSEFKIFLMIVVGSIPFNENLMNMAVIDEYMEYICLTVQSEPIFIQSNYTDDELNFEQLGNELECLY